MRETILRAAGVTAVVALMSTGVCCRAVTPQGQAVTLNAQSPIQISESFDGPKLNASLWSVTRKNDFQESTIDIVDGRLRLRAATIGTTDDTVKFHGVRSTQPILLREPFELAFDLDWNDQKNGCYMTAGVVLCATATDQNPLDERNWLKFEYIGVPPGRNARAWLSTRKNGVEKALCNEGWPTEQKTGRKIGRERVRILWRDGTLILLENDTLLWQDRYSKASSSEVYLYLQMSSHSNYPPREVFFDNVFFGPLASTTAEAAPK